MKRFSLFSFSGLSAEWRSVMRGLVHKPGYAVASAIMLALALAANGVAFGVVYGFLLRPLPYAHPNRLIVVQEYDANTSQNSFHAASYRLYHTLKENPHDIVGVGLSELGDTAPIKINHTTQAVFYNEVTPSAFTTIGTHPILGRLPSSVSGKIGGPGEAVLSYGLWQSAFGGSPTAIGQTIKMRGTSYRIVGVMPHRFFLPFGGIALWVTEAVTPAMIQRNDASPLVMARLKPGITLRQFNQTLDTVIRTQMLREMTPLTRSNAVKQGYTLQAAPFRPTLLSFFGGGTAAWLLQAAALLLLFLALANTVNLTLVRQQERLPELATRYALGASRAKLLGHAATEAALLVLIAGGLAMLLTWASIAGINAFGIIPRFSPFYLSFGASQLGFITGLMLVTAVCLTISSGGVIRTRRLLGAIGRSPGTSHARGIAFMQRTLAALQTGLACALLIAGFLLSISLWNLFTQPLGFQPEKRIVLQVYLPQTTTAVTAWQQAEPALRALPQVVSAAASLRIPYSLVGSNYGRILAKDSQSLGDHPANVRIVSATGGFFRTLAIPLLHGSHFGGAGTTNTRTIVISASLAKRLFGTTDIIGHTLSAGGNPRRIVGVTQNISWQPTPSGDIAGTVYQTLFMGQQQSGGFMEIVAHSRGSAADAIPMIERTLRRAIPGSAIYRAQTFDNLIRGGLAFRAVAAGLVGAFAILALILATLGVFAVMGFIVRGRLAEYGIRATLGATPKQLFGTGLVDAARALIPGLVVGLAFAWLLERVMATFLYHVSAAVIPVFALGVVLIAVVTFSAAIAPLARAIGAPISRLLNQ